jgi:hypothetical protein
MLVDDFVAELVSLGDARIRLAYFLLRRVRAHQDVPFFHLGAVHVR